MPHHLCLLFNPQTTSNDIASGCTNNHSHHSSGIEPTTANRCYRHIAVVPVGLYRKSTTATSGDDNCNLSARIVQLGRCTEHRRDDAATGRSASYCLLSLAKWTTPAEYPIDGKHQTWSHWRRQYCCKWWTAGAWSWFPVTGGATGAGTTTTSTHGTTSVNCIRYG